MGLDNNKKDKKNYYSDKVWAWIFLLPGILGLLILTVYPLIFNINLSLHSWDLLNDIKEAEFVGLDIYASIINDASFWNSVKVTAIYIFGSVSLELIVGMFLAIILYQKFIGRGIARTLIICPMIITPVIVGTTWRLLYNSNGLINYILKFIGINAPSFLANEATALPAVMIADIWEWSPLIMLILLAGLQGIPVQLFESAQVDGASKFQVWRYIMLPMLKPSILIALLIRFMDAFRTFAPIYAMTGGGPGTSTEILNIYTYHKGFEFFHMSEAAALTILSMIFIIVFSLTLLKIVKKVSGGLWV